MLLEMARNGGAERIPGQRANSTPAPQPHSASSVGSVLPCWGEALLIFLKFPPLFFLSFWGSSGAEMKSVLF